MLLAVLLCAALPAACTPLGPALPFPTDTPTSTPTGTPTPTPTIVWFPPTATPTPFPTPQVTPTPDYRPGLGEILLTDDFSSGEAWSLGRTSAGGAALGKNELTIALSEPGAYVASLREAPVLRDFYLEITASPSLCRSADEYGLLLRASSLRDFYRFSLSCDGQVRLDRLVNGTASSPQPWTLSGAFPPGAPSISRLAIWAKEKEMRFFVNEEYQFTVSDPMLPSGSIGVFARSAGDNAVTINFSELIIREIDE
ncbi:MAG TPA: hypothetical protein VGA03_06430 [Anaerolineales bacterium]